MKDLSAFSFIISTLRPYWIFYGMMMLAPIASGISPILMQYSIKLTIDLFTQNDFISFKQSLKPIFCFVLSQAILDISWRLHNFAQMKCTPYVFRDLTLKIVQHCFDLPYSYFQNNLSGSIVGKIKGIGDNFFKAQTSLEFKLTRPLLITFFSGIALALTQIKLFLFIIAFLMIYSPIAVYFFLKLSQIETKRHESWTYLFGTIVDKVINIFNVFSFSKKEEEIKNLKEYYKNYHIPISLQYFRYDFIVSIILAILYWIFLISIFCYSIYLKNKGILSLGDTAFAMSLTFLFSENAWSTTMEIKDFLKDIGAFKASYELMTVQKNTIDCQHPQEISIKKGLIEFKNVSFSYPHSSIKQFEQFSLVLSPGEKIGLVGQSGAGKSTLVSILLKYFKISEGDILIDHQSIYKASSDSLRAQIALIPQETILFHRTIFENISYAKDNASLEEVEIASKKAQIHDFIKNLPEGYSTIVGERGVKLSGGQKQRISIARAFLKQSPILILDEATSSLDSQTELEIQASLERLLKTKKMTVIAIAHRLSTIKNMDRIIVLKEGKIEEEGSFETLIEKKNGSFKKLWDHQINASLSFLNHL